VFKENIEKIFMDEVREKKRTGTGSFHMRGKGVKHGISGALRTPSYFLSNKEKKNLNGEVESFNMFTTIIPYEEFERKDEETQKNLLIKWREIYENSKITEDMGISNKRYFDLVAGLNIPKKPRGGARNPQKGRIKKLEKKPEIVEKELHEAVEKMPVIENEPKLESAVKLLTKGLYLEYNGEYNAEDLNKIFTKLQLIIDGEKNKFNISLSLTEKTK
jgi:hypothetical protein